jgi:hypothetical protein
MTGRDNELFLTEKFIVLLQAILCVPFASKGIEKRLDRNRRRMPGALFAEAVNLVIQIRLGLEPPPHRKDPPSREAACCARIHNPSGPKQAAPNGAYARPAQVANVTLTRASSACAG